VKGNGKVYICIFDGPGLPRGQRFTIDNKRRTKTTAYDKGTHPDQMGTSAYEMGTSAFHLKSSKHHLKTSKHHLQTSTHAKGTSRRNVPLDWS
jgi:hypothetical protein